ncbi:MAG TPA: acetate/propionate family kinase [Ktedonobacteraceae bacterium]
MTDAILALNAGSSSIKFSLFDTTNGISSHSLLYQGAVDGIGGNPHFLVQDTAGQKLVDEQLKTKATSVLGHKEALGVLLDWIERFETGLTLIAVGHRVVHGGTLFLAPVLVDSQVINQLESLVPLAPLHQPHNLAAIRSIATINPNVPQVACFDTAFHRTQPPIAQAFALPRDLTDQGIKRYGFHGLSYEYIASVLPDYVDYRADGRVIVAHLGNGASMCALQGRKSIATTMSFTALDGLPMGTRCGSIDPGVILYLLSELHMDAPGITDLLYHRSGLLGVSGQSSDMRELLTSNSPRAAEAIDLFVYHIQRELGSLAAALGGLDVLVFTAGIGEHAAPIRARVCQDLQWLGVQFDETANRSGGPKISSDSSAVSVWVIPTDEDLMIARHTSNVIHR